MARKFEIRNSTVELLTFQIEGKEDGVQVVYRDESIPPARASKLFSERSERRMDDFFTFYEGICCVCQGFLVTLRINKHNQNYI